MDVWDRIQDALTTKALDPKEFETCALALLGDIYPGLSPVEGGHDFGRDGDIYFLLEPGSDLSRRGRLLATIDDPMKNVRTGLRRMREERLRVDLLVLVTSRALSARQRASIEGLAAQYEVPVTEFYARDWLAAALWRCPLWRKRLLGVTGELSALVPRPLSLLERSDTLTELVGRDTEQQALRDLVDDHRDVIVAGAPGCGKTRLCAELGDRVLFLEPGEPHRVADDVREHRPTAVVVDDARGRGQQIELLRRIRVEENQRFSVIAVTWRAELEDVQRDLPGAAIVVLEPLERKMMDTIIQSAGARSFRARHLILDQAEGRPGWALALCQVLLHGDSEELLQGTAVLGHVREFVRRSAGSDAALDALACVAALRGLGVDDLGRIGDLLRRPIADISQALHTAATAGLLDYENNRWTLQPALAAPLVAARFFDDPPQLPWSLLTRSFPDRHGELMSSVQDAAMLGVAGARRAADEWAHALPDPARWDALTWCAVRQYAALDASTSAWAVAAARETLAADRLIEQSPLLGAYDPIGAAAKKQLVDATRRFLVPDAIHGLLDLAIGDDRPLHSNPDHPLRVLGDVARGIDPDYGTTHDVSAVIARTVGRWLRATSISGARLIVAARAWAGILSPEVSGVWPTPGSFSVIAHSNEYDSGDHLHELAILWTEHVRPLLPSFADNAGETAERGAALYALIDLAEAWLSLGSRLVHDAERVDDDQVLAATEGGRRMINDLRPLVQGVPGLALRTQRLLRWCGAEDMATFEIDVQLNVVVGPEHPEQVGDDWEAFHTRRRRELEDVATQLADLGPQAGAARAIELIQQAELVRPGADTASLIQLLASRASPITAWFFEAVRQRWPLLIQAILIRSLREDPDILDPAAVGSILDDAELHAGVIAAVLTATKRSPSVDLVLDAMTAADAWHLRKSLIFRDTMDPVLERLLSHPVPVIAAATALALLDSVPSPVWHFDGNAATLWRSAILQLNIDDLSSEDRRHVDRLMSRFARHDPDFFERWFEVQLGKHPYVRGQIQIRKDEEDPLAILPRVHRERLARRCAGLRYAGANPLTALIGTDAELAATLLQEGVVSTDMILSAMLGQRGAMLEALGPLLIRDGVIPEQIAATGNWDTAYWGPESSVHQKRLDYFTELAKRDDSDLRTIGRAGIQQQQKLVDQALAHERSQRVRGNL